MKTTRTTIKTTIENCTVNGRIINYNCTEL